jgi:tetratricopeptide (TPR) repeat protein
MGWLTLRISLRNFSIHTDDGFRYPLTKRFLYLYVYLAFERTKKPFDGGFIDAERIRHLPFWEKNTLISIGKQVRRHIEEMERLGRNLIEARQKIKGPFRLKLDPQRIVFDSSDELVRTFLGLDKLAVFYVEETEVDLYRYVEEIAKGDILFKEGLMPKALATFRAALKQSISINQRMAILLRIGRILERQGNYGEALRTYEDAEKLVREEAGLDYYDSANLYTNLAWLYYRENNLELSEKTHLRALDLIRGKTHNLLFGRIYNGLGKISEARGNYEEAVGFFKNALLFECQDSDFYGIQAAYFNIGNVYKGMADQLYKVKDGTKKEMPKLARDYYLQAMNWANKCIDLCDRAGVGDETSQDRLLVSYCYYRLGNPKKAFLYAEEAEKMASTAANKRDMALSYELMGKTLRMMGGDTADRASQLLEKSLEYYREIGHTQRIKRLTSQLNIGPKSATPRKQS